VIEKLLNKTTIELIDLIAKEPTYVRDIAEKLKTSPGYVFKIIHLLKKHNIVGEKRQKNRKIIFLNNENIFTRKIRALINTEKISRNIHFRELMKEGAVGIYGSYAEGMDDNLSDIDLWVCTEKPSYEIQKVVTELEKNMKKKISFLLLNSKKIRELKTNDYEFYIRLKLTSTVFGGNLFD